MNKSVSIILPVYNEEALLEKVVASIVDFSYWRKNNYEIILVDDGSTDRTPDMVERLSRDEKYISCIHHPRNKGYGAALVSGFRKARHPLVIWMDADGQFCVSELERLIHYSNDYDIVAGYRIKRRDPWYRVMLGVTYTRLICFLFGISLKDINCGAKAIKKSMLDRFEIVSTGAIIDAEILVKAIRQGYSVKEVGMSHFSRERGDSKGARFNVIIKAICELWNLIVWAYFKK